MLPMGGQPRGEGSRWAAAASRVTEGQPRRSSEAQGHKDKGESSRSATQEQRGSGAQGQGGKGQPQHLHRNGTVREPPRKGRQLQEQEHAMAETGRAQNKGETSPKGKTPSLAQANQGHWPRAFWSSWVPSPLLFGRPRRNRSHLSFKGSISHPAV